MKHRSTLARLAALVAVGLMASACNQGTGEPEQAGVDVSVVDDGSGTSTSTGEPDTDTDTDPEGDDTADQGADTTSAATTDPASDDESGTGSLSEGAATDAVPPPTCEPGPRNLFEPEVRADIETISTNQIIEGGIEEFSIDVWKIDLCEDQLVFFDALGPCSGEDGDWLRWKLILPDGDEAIDLGDMINSVGSCGGDHGPIRIPESGEYAVHFGYKGVGEQEADGYRFEILNVAQPEQFTIEVGDLIDVDLAPGAGRIEFPGSRDQYSIELEEGDRIFFDVGDDCDGADGDWLRARLILPDGDEAIDLGDLINSVGSCGDHDPVSIPETGRYVLDIGYGDDSDSTARNYSIEVRDAG